MTYNERNFLLKKTGMNEWTISNSSGTTLHVLNRCTDANDAQDRARAWASSWQSIGIKVVDEQDELRDKVPSKT